MNEIEQLKADNASLAAALRRTQELLIVIRQQVFPGLGLPSKYTVWMHEALSVDGSTALSELIAPTVELLEQLTYPSTSAINNELVHEELARLRAVINNKA